MYVCVLCVILLSRDTGQLAPSPPSPIHSADIRSSLPGGYRTIRRIGRGVVAVYGVVAPCFARRKEELMQQYNNTTRLPRTARMGQQFCSALMMLVRTAESVQPYYHLLMLRYDVTRGTVCYTVYKLW